LTAQAAVPLPAAGDTTSPTYINRWRAMVFIAISLLVISLDNTILNVALPSISRDLNASSSELQWIIDSYVLVFASLLLTMGALGDKVGRKRALQAGLVLFAGGSLWCAVSADSTSLILARAFTGIGGALIMPATLSIISATFPAHERARAIALWAAIFGIGVTIGPLTGGLLLRFFSWHAVFFINLPIVAIALIGGQRFIAESRDESAPPLDIPGVLLSISGLFALLYGIITAGEQGWTAAPVWIGFAVAAVLLTAFAWWESRTPYPMLPLSFFRNPAFTVANLTLVLVTFCLLGWTFFVTQYFQSILGWSPLNAGLAALPIGVILTVVSARSAAVAARLGTNRAIALGALLCTVAMIYWRLTMNTDTTYPIFFVGQLFFGTGLGLMISPATNSVMSSVPVHKAGIGSAMNDMTRQLGGALGIAVLGSVANTMYRAQLLPIVDNVAGLPEAARETALHGIQGAHTVAADLASDLSAQLLTVSNSAFLQGIYQAQIVAIVVLLVVAFMAYRFLPRTVTRISHA
jgi:EmrB/QacA subfamily drug resistance transporter